MIFKNCDVYGDLDYKDVFIFPQYSDVTSRSQVDTSVSIKGHKVNIPVISANMDTVTNADMARAMFSGGGIGAVHRFQPIETQIAELKEACSDSKYFVSVGVNQESRERAEKLYDAGHRWFVVDIAHGHSRMMKDMLGWLRSEFGYDIIVMAGNVASPEGTRDLMDWGADIIKVGIGPGAVCLTKNVTGVTVPQFSAVAKCAEVVKKHNLCVSSKILLVADGGITEIGDIAKAIGAGADMVMCGKLFAACNEAPGPRVNGKKVYRGMASKDAMLTIRDESALPTPEGMSTLLSESGESVSSVLQHIKGGLQSSFSYSNSLTIEDFHKKCSFGIRHTQMK